MPNELREILHAELNTLWMDLSKDALLETVAKNAPRLLELAGAYPELSPSVGGLQSLLSKAVAAHITENSEAIRAIWGLDGYADRGSPVRKRAVEDSMREPWNKVRRNEPRRRLVNSLVQAVLQTLADAGLVAIRDHLQPQFEARDYIGVNRDTLEVAIRLRLDAAESFVLHGEPGNGKSYASRKAALRYAGSEASVLLLRGKPDPQLGRQYEDDLEACLLKLGAQVPLDTARRERELTYLLSEASGRLVMIFDDVPEVLVARLLPKKAVIPIVVVTRTVLSNLDIPHLMMGEYTVSEALRAASRLMPGEEPERLSALCQALGNRPEPIDLACRFLSMESAPLTLQQLLVSLSESAPVTLESVGGSCRLAVSAATAHLL